MTFFVEQIETRASVKAAAHSHDLPDILAFCGIGLLVSITAAACGWLVLMPGLIF